MTGEPYPLGEIIIGDLLQHLPNNPKTDIEHLVLPYWGSCRSYWRCFYTPNRVYMGTKIERTMIAE